MSDEAEREAAFLLYLTRSENYMAAIAEAGDTAWHAGDIERRRELFMRRYKTHTPERTNKS